MNKLSIFINCILSFLGIFFFLFSMDVICIGLNFGTRNLVNIYYFIIFNAHIIYTFEIYIFLKIVYLICF